MSVCHTGISWCHKCGFHVKVRGIRMLGGSKLDTGCCSCGAPITHSVPGGVVWVYDEEPSILTMERLP